MMVALLILIAIYCVSLGALIIAWYGIRPYALDSEEIHHYYSIVVAIRNEESKIEQMAKAVVMQNFPAEHFELIFIDDHSEDGSRDVINEFIAKHSISARLLTLKKGVGKKAAIGLGIEAARGSVIITTDADCQMESGWLRSISTYFENADARLVFGPVSFTDEDTFFKRLQTIEFASLIGTGAAGLGLGIPNMCNGANFAFLKQTFNEVGGYMGNERIASGDDEFLMHKFYARYPEKVFFNKSAKAIVLTEAMAGIYSFYQQRKRWASKWKFYTSPKTSALAIFIFLSNISCLFAYYLLFSGKVGSIWLLIPLLCKAVLEFIFLSSVLRFLKKKLPLFLFIFLQFTYPLYVILFGLAANFGTYTWKGRKH